MEKDIAKVPKNSDTDTIIRIDDFGGKIGVTIREFVHSERYTGFTKAGTRIAPENFKAFKDAINSIDEAELATMQPSQEAIDKNKAFLEKKASQRGQSSQFGQKPTSKPTDDSELEF